MIWNLYCRPGYIALATPVYGGFGGVVIRANTSEFVASILATDSC
jgi:hypothetical protein